MKRLLVVDVSTRVIFHTTLVGSIYLLFVGHNQPGGGFVGGLVAGAAIALRFVAGGVDEVRSLTRLKPWTILGAGLLVAGVTAVVPIVAGDAVLTSASWTVDAPLLGTIKTTSALVFDTGVFIAVVGLVFMIFEAFGDEPLAEDEP
ncbi:MAG: MnhB domain-containing protein [Ilumatobacteraceae bacterium]